MSADPRPHPSPLAADVRDTAFTACWESYCRARGLPVRGSSYSPGSELLQRRQLAQDFFSDGMVHHARTMERLEALLGDDDEAARRLAAIRAMGS